jgi:copper chaperone
MIKLKIVGMTCDHCVKAVTEALSNVPGVEKVIDVDRSRHEAVVSGHPQTEQLVRAVEDAGYLAQIA